jgi:carboxylate-amine ligase
VAEAILLAALVRGLVMTAMDDLSQGLTAPRVPVETLRAATWRASRDGITGHALDTLTGRLVPARSLVDRLVERVSGALAQAGDLDTVAGLLAELDRSGTGAARQRAALARNGLLRDVVDQCVADGATRQVQHMT